MRLLLTISLLIMIVSSKAQNLISNSSFEEFAYCPSSPAEIEFPVLGPSAVIDWSKPTIGTPDYFNSCSTGEVSVPENFAGSQFARTGDAYCGFISVNTDIPAGGWHPYREYIQTKFANTLISGHQYYFGYWINLAKGIGEFTIASDKMGAYFSDTLLGLYSTDRPLEDLIPQIVSPAGYTYSDTSGWSPVFGIFTAVGTENAVVIGNFSSIDNVVTDTAGINSDGIEALMMSYYYCDDVCLVDLDNPTDCSVYNTGFCSDDFIVVSGRDSCSAYLWNDGNIGKSITLSSSGTYWVRSIDANNCLVFCDTFKVLTMSLQCENCIMMPNAFSPNNDGLNDEFRTLVNCALDTYSFRIFNRWGQLVFTSTNVDDAWDGTVNGSSVDVGTYFYQLEAMPIIKELGKISKKGDVTIIR